MRVPALAGSVAAHLLIGALALLVVVHPTTTPAEPVPVQMVFAPLPDAAPPTLPPVAASEPAPAAEATASSVPPAPGPPPQAEPPPAPAPPSKAEPPPSPPPAEVPNIPVPELPPPKPRGPEPAPRQQPPPRAAHPPHPPHRIVPRQPSSAAAEPRAAVVAPAPSVAPIPSAASSRMPAPPPAQAQGEALAAWRGVLATWLSAHRRYPEQARRDGVQGQPTVRFTVEPSGRVTSVELVTSSGSTVLDEATIAMLRGATLPPFPPGLAQAARTESVRVHYSLEQ